MNEGFITEQVYPRLPVVLQNAFCSAYGLAESATRYGKVFDTKLEGLLASEWWSAVEMQAYQDEQIRLTIRNAYDEVPFYRERMQKLHLRPDDIRGRADLPKLPVTTKEDVRFNLERMVASGASRRRLVARHTSGTTGKALHFYSTKESIAFQWAVWSRHRLRFGVNPGSWHANFTGKQAVPPGQQRRPYWRWNLPMRQAILNMHHLTPAKIGDVRRFLDSHGFVLFTGYPSIIHALVLVLREAGLSLQRPPKLVITGAENVLDTQARDIKAEFHATLTDQYGSSEGCGNASHCERFRYHEDIEFGVLERSPLEGCGETTGKILCTGFACPEFPLIRYDIGDIGTWASSDQDCGCGRKGPSLLRIDGRKDDYVLTPEGRRLMRFDYVFKEALNVAEVQVVQDAPGELRLRVVRRPEYSTEDEKNIVSEIHRWISPQMSVRFDYVKEIERTLAGKFKAVVSNLATREEHPGQAEKPVL